MDNGTQRGAKRKAKHPNRAQLSQFLNGSLPAKLQMKVEQHIQACDRCVAELETIDNDTLSIRVMEAATEFQSMTMLQLPEEEGLPPELENHPRYELKERIGSGGMGDVYRAVHRSMNRPVAIKILKRHLFENDRAVARFHNEIKIAAQLNHVNIVHSYDAEVTGGLNLLVMELVDGSKLSDWIDPVVRPTVGKTCRIAVQIATGLQYADSRRMTHRDIKPQNILITPEGVVKISDFGLAKFAIDSAEGADHSLTLEGETFGTPDYIAPEQIRDTGSADLRSDIYSLGCTMYFMLTGRPPFTESSVGEKLAGHLEKEPEPLGQLRAELPPPLVATVEKMMAKDPADRYQNYEQLLGAMEPFVDEKVLSGNRVALPMAIPLPVASVASVASETSETSDAPTAVDLTRLPAAAAIRPINRRQIVLGGIASLLLISSVGLLSGWIPLPGHPPSLNKRIAIVIPAEYAWHPELNEIITFFAAEPSVTLEWVAEKKGDISFSGLDQSYSETPLTLTVTRTLAELSAGDFDAVIFTGGWVDGNLQTTAYAFDQELKREAKAFVGELLQEEKPVAAVCGGMSVLANAGVLRGKRVANCQFAKGVLGRSGAVLERLQEPPQGDVVRDGMIVTASYSMQLRELCETVMEMVSR